MEALFFVLKNEVKVTTLVQAAHLKTNKLVQLVIIIFNKIHNGDTFTKVVKLFYIYIYIYIIYNCIREQRSNPIILQLKRFMGFMP